MNKKFKSLFSDTLIFAVGNILTKLILFVLMPIYTSAMTTSEYGTGELIYNTVELTLPIVTLCLYEAVFRFSIDIESDHKKLLSNALSTILKIFIVVAVIAAVFFAITRYAYTLCFVLILFSWSIRQLFAHFARGIGRGKVFAASGVIQALTLCISNIILLVGFHLGVYGYLVSIIIANIISIIYLMIILKLPKYISFKEKDKHLLRAMLVFALPMIPNTLSWWFVNISARYIIIGFCGASIAGLFTAASKLPSIVHLMSTIFQQAWQFSSSKEINKKDGNSFFSNVFKIYSSFILICTSVLVVASPLISKIILQGEFYSAWQYVPLLLLSACLNCYSVYFGSFYTAAKKNKMIMISTIIGAVLNISICFISVPFIGVFGALIASAVSYFVIVVIRIIDTRKYAKISIDWGITLITFVLLTVQSVLITIFPNTFGIIASAVFLCVILIINFIKYLPFIKAAFAKLPKLFRH